MAAPKTDNSNEGENDENHNEDDPPSTPLATNLTDIECSTHRRGFKMIDAVLVLISLITYTTDALTGCVTSEILEIFKKSKDNLANSLPFSQKPTIIN